MPITKTYNEHSDTDFDRIGASHYLEQAGRLLLEITVYYEPLEIGSVDSMCLCDMKYASILSRPAFSSSLPSTILSSPFAFVFLLLLQGS